jgi:hypothetical protein
MTEGINIPSYSDTYTSTGSASPKTEGAVMREWSDLNQQLSKLGELVDMLRCRLGPITGPEMPIAGKLADGGPPRQELSPLAESIRKDKEAVMRLQGEISYILTRLEI